MSEPREPVIDAMLEELLGGVQPPDLTQRILDAHAATHDVADADDSAVDVALGKKISSPIVAGDVQPKKIPNENVLHIDSEPVSRRAISSSQFTPTFWAAAAVVLMAVSAVGYWGFITNQRLEFANRPPETTTHHPAAPVDVVVLPPEVVTERSASDPATEPKSNGANSNALANADVSSPTSDETEFGIQTESPEFQRSLRPGTPQKDSRIVAFINRELQRTWEAKSLSPTGSVNDAVWLERATSFLAGRKPTRNEAMTFSRNRDREQAIDVLLSSTDFSNHWANVLAKTLVDGGDSYAVDQQALVAWIAHSLRNGKAYDQLAFELLSAVGSTDPDAEDYNPATNFLLAHQRVAKDARGHDVPATKLAATDKVCQVFLGQQMQCAQCHDHPAKTWTQQQYYEVASFFAQMRPVDPDEEGQLSRLVNADYAGTDGNVAAADLFFNRPNETGVSVYPRFLDGRTLQTKSGSVQDVDRRAELAHLIVSSEDFSKATMNRLWDYAFGSGFTRPVDDMGSHNPPTHPQLLTKLAVEFANRQFDLKSALGWIAMSSAFERRERAPSDALAGKFDMFSSFSRQDAETYDTIGWPLEVLAKNTRAGGLDEIHAAQLGGDKKDVSPEKLAREERRIIGMLNEKLLRTDDGSLIARLVENPNLTDDMLVTHLFYSTVGRPPSNYELNQGRRVLKRSSRSVASRRNALKQIGWILLNSDEFRSH